MRSEPPPLPAEPAPAAPAKSSTSPWKIVLIVLGVLVGIVLLFVALGVGYVLLAKELPVEDRDKTVVLTASDMTAWVEDLQVDPTKETWKKLKNIDGSHELEYEYEADDFYINCHVGVDASRSDAKVNYVALVTGAQIGAGLEDGSWEDSASLMRFGDESKASILKVGGNPVGNLFACRKGTRVFLAVWSGVYFEDGDGMRELLEPILERWARYNP